MTRDGTRLLAMSATGRFVVLRRRGALDVVDTGGVTPRRSFELDGGDFAICGPWLCILLERSLRIERIDGSQPGRELSVSGSTLRQFRGRAASALLVDQTLVSLEPAPAILGNNETETRWFPLHGRALLAAAGSRLSIVTPAKTTSLDVTLTGELRDAVPLFGGRSMALLVAERDGDAVFVVDASGRLIKRLRVRSSTWHAFAPERGHLLLGAGDTEVISIDLRYGGVLCGTAPHPVSALVIDDDGKTIAIAGPSASDVPVVSMMRVDELLRDATTAQEVIEEEGIPAVEPSEPVFAPPAAQPAPTPAASVTASEIEIPAALPLAFGNPARATDPTATSDAEPFRDASEHLAAMLDLIAARAALAIAEAWHSGRISADTADQLPFEREVTALAGAPSELAGDRVDAASVRVRDCARILAQRTLATRAAGVDVPFASLAHELGLSPIATQILAVVLAPRVRPEIARLYRILGNETHRPICDDAIVGYVLGTTPSMRDGFVDQLTAESPLFELGVLVREPRGGLDVDRAVIARLRGRQPTTSPATTFRAGGHAIEDLVLDRNVVRTLVLELAEPRAFSEPVRVVIRGRRGVGRHSLVASLAARIDHQIACIDAAQLPREEVADALRRELARARIARAVPVVSGLEVYANDPDIADVLRQVTRSHCGPIVFRTRPNVLLPLDPGYIDVALPALTETERQLALRDLLAAEGMVADVDLLARRYRIGPGTMTRIAAETRVRVERTGGDATAIFDELARQHVASRIGTSAHRITRLAEWDDVALPDEIIDSLRELIGRARYGRTVYEQWGYDAKITTARGLTALFYGPPGTGKTMVAGLIARELGLDLYRIDLSKVMSKWIGETEKNLGEVFDAAEDGQIMLLFDEADALFAKRSEVKSSNDRYANLEVNYLLQRLDTFEGLALLTTNLEGSIDPAFKRRLSMRLYFPFPDEETRARLWESHVLPSVPTAGKLDFEQLARRFPLSGGYIRNSALRAAFLAAQEQTSLTQSHLERAVLLEYRDLGKLAEDGRME